MACPARTSGADQPFCAIVSNHDAVIECRNKPSFTESRRVLNVQDNDLPYNLTSMTLAGPDMISEEPYVFTDNVQGSMLAFYHLGTKLAGHSKVVHGGMGRACFPRLAGKIAVTAKLDLEYKRPIPVDSFVLITAETTEVQGRKAWVEGVIKDAQDGQLYVKAIGLFIEPRWSSEMMQVI